MKAETILENMRSRAAEELGEDAGFSLGFLLPCGPYERAFVLANDGSSCPFAWMEADPETGEVLKFAYCTDEPLVDGYDVDAAIDRTPPAKMDVQEYIIKNREAREAYETLRAGGSGERFLSLFRELVSEDLMKYYRGLAPDFINQFCEGGK